MKPLSELVKEWRARAESLNHDLEEPLAALAHDCWKADADELQAWLREADEEVLLETESEQDACTWIMWIRDKLLGTYPGTTRMEGKK